MQANSKKLTFSWPALAFLGFIALMVILILGLTAYDKQRKAEVYNRYATETNNYISANRSNVINFFANVFPPKSCDYQPYNTATPCPSGAPNAQIIAQYLP